MEKHNNSLDTNAKDTNAKKSILDHHILKGSHRTPETMRHSLFVCNASSMVPAQPNDRSENTSQPQFTSPPSAQSLRKNN